MLRVCWVAILFLLSFAASAAQYELGNNFSRIRPLQVDYTTKVESLEQARKLTPDAWETQADAQLNLGIQSHRVWLHFSVNQVGKKAQTVLLAVENPLLDHLRFFHYSDGVLVASREVGDTVKLSRRDIKDEAILIELTFPSGSHNEIYLEVATDSGLRIPLSLWRPDSYMLHKSHFNLIFGLLIGFVLALAITNGVLFAISRKFYFILGALYLTTLSLLLIYQFGFGYRYFHPNVPWLQQVMIPQLLLTGTLLLNPLTERVLKLRSRGSRALVAVRIGFAAYLLLFLILPWLQNSQAAQVSLLASGLMLSLLLGITIQTIRKKERRIDASLLAVSLAAYLLAMFYITLVFYGFPLLNNASHPILVSCYGISGLTISFLLIYKLMRERDAKVKQQQTELAQRQANDALLARQLELEEQAKHELEIKIEERTFELQVALRELEEKNRELEERNMEDPLSGIKNRRYFDKKLLMELRRSKREQTSFSLIMLDIDRFKEINDSYGHTSGDQVIRTVATIIKDQLKRPLDEVCRYGGEEFAVLLPNTPEEGAVQLAEQIRRSLAGYHILINDKAIQISASLGVYSSIADNINDPEHFVTCADKALYHAKEHGRNQVVSFNTLS